MAGIARRSRRSTPSRHAFMLCVYDCALAIAARAVLRREQVISCGPRSEHTTFINAALR